MDTSVFVWFVIGSVTGCLATVFWVAFFMVVEEERADSSGSSNLPDSIDAPVHGVDHVERPVEVVDCRSAGGTIYLGSTAWYVGKDENDTASN